jgi:hypothetical protein
MIVPPALGRAVLVWWNDFDRFERPLADLANLVLDAFTPFFVVVPFVRHGCD